ncbi:MAG: hypothetical protein UY81_C0002G0022 [Candidatus Giovannonibacteria bacterium GW2011_GWA2_53_7]|uniref:Uncharacterized protein n=1 Tax=Candidatus Giovannonibacteria bacterium GW2011_GWA2_53_7 TaxID=1618650 RepID=A0A0G2AWA3_9BACT|nr:MAG: hypothetical protein UY81_C0002G0022 [Candidatus Giovannonibacteria bacterium GW2011_GWA2_53_7]
MDHQKDNQRIGQDVKGQSFGPYLSNVHNNVDPMTLNYISKKSEKLTTALYMVTDVMNEQEPMKWKLRESGVELLSDIMLAAAASSSERLTLLRLVEKKIEQVVSFLDVAWTARMMSEMNAAILKKEYVAIKDTIEKELSRTVGVGGSVLHESFFHVTRELPSRSAHVEENGIDTREVRASGVSYKNVQENEATRTMEAQKDISSTETSKDTVPMSAVAPVERKNIGASSFAVSTSGEGSRSMSPATAISRCAMIPISSAERGRIQ